MRIVPSPSCSEPFQRALAVLLEDDVEERSAGEHPLEHAVDGRVARCTGTVSRLGARFDMEVDAVLILVLAVLAWRFDKAAEAISKYEIATDTEAPWRR